MNINSFYTRRNAAILAVVVVALAGGYFGWQSLQKKEIAIEESEARPIIEVVPVTSKTLFREDQLPGEIDAYQDVIIYPKISGFVQWIGVDRGSVVKKNQLLAVMYAPEFVARRNEGLARVAAARAALAAEQSKLEDLEADLKKRRANLISDQSTYERIQEASIAPGVIADNDVVQWAETVEQDREEVNSLVQRVNAKDHEVALRKEELLAKEKGYTNEADFASYLEIRAPFNGYITERKMHVGSFVGPNGSGAYPPICRIKQLDLLRIIAPVPERDTGGVVPGSEVEFSVSTYPRRRFVGTVARISNSLEKATRTMPVELNYFNPDYKVLPGMFCQVYWPTRRRESSLFVPESAVVSTPLDTFVCRLKDGLVEWISVTKGQAMNGMIEVFGNIHEGDLVARNGSEELQNQSTVKTTQPHQTVNKPGAPDKSFSYRGNPS